MAARMRSRSPLRSASSNGRVLQEIVPEAAARGREVSPETLQAIATMESIESLGEGWTDGGRRCYICKRYTRSPLKLDLLGKEQADCPLRRLFLRVLTEAQQRMVRYQVRA